MIEWSGNAIWCFRPLSKKHMNKILLLLTRCVFFLSDSRWNEATTFKLFGQGADRLWPHAETKIRKQLNPFFSLDCKLLFLHWIDFRKLNVHDLVVRLFRLAVAFARGKSFIKIVSHSPSQHKLIVLKIMKHFRWCAAMNLTKICCNFSFFFFSGLNSSFFFEISIAFHLPSERKEFHGQFYVMPPKLSSILLAGNNVTVSHDTNELTKIAPFISFRRMSQQWRIEFTIIDFSKWKFIWCHPLYLVCDNREWNWIVLALDISDSWTIKKKQQKTRDEPNWWSTPNI